MRRVRRFDVDGRLKLKTGDKVRINPRARRELAQRGVVKLQSSDLGTVSKIQWEATESNKFGALVRVHGKLIWFSLSDLEYKK